MDASAAGIGHRIYEVRRALGPDPRHELPQRAFAELITRQAEGLFPAEDRPRYDSSVIARLEKGDRRATVQDIVVIASVDPQRRGKLWLAWGEERDGTLTAIKEPPNGLRHTHRAPSSRTAAAKKGKSA